jgi:4-diphosphocytidyl-2-C-methyl-D-erythritol kinase
VKLRALAYAKVNLCLFLGPPRPDGRHELVTVMESLSLADEVTIETLPDGRDTVICPGVEDPNLARTAIEALRSNGWDAPPVRVTIDKRIAIAAGMGGGSADAAATLRLGDQVSPVAPEVLAEIAASLGSDVPGLLAPGAVLATGAGEEVAPVTELPPHAFAIVPQPFGLSTAEVYSQADRMGLARSADALGEVRRALLAALATEVGLPAAILVNDLQAAALSLAPQIGDALQAIRAAGADHATVCGSGPTAAGVFWGPRAIKRAAEAAARLDGEYPAALAAAPVAGSVGGASKAHLRGGAQSASR